MNELERLTYDLENYLKFCVHSATFLYERSKLNKINDPEQSKEDYALSGIYIRKYKEINNILDNECLRYEKFTYEIVEKFWNEGMANSLFSEIPPEYRKEFYKEQGL